MRLASARAAAGSCGCCWWRACCCRWRAGSAASCSPTGSASAAPRAAVQRRRAHAVGEPDLRVGLFTLGLAVLTGSRLRAGAGDPADEPGGPRSGTLKDEATAVVGGGGRFRLRKGLVVAQVALSLLLLVGAGLFTRSLITCARSTPASSRSGSYAFDVDPRATARTSRSAWARIGASRSSSWASPAWNVGVRRGGDADEHRTPLEHGASVEGYERRRART